MSLKDFRVMESVGKGSFASVYKVVRKSDNKIYALKRVKIGKMSKKEISDALNEIRFLASIRHQNIVGFLEAFLEENETELCIIMEYCGCGDLAAKVERYKRRREYIDEDVIWRYLIQSLKALQHLHEKGICHRDLKTSNCFLAEDGSVKVGDMNVSKRLKGGQLQTQIGTPYYMSPEIWNNRPYDASSDMWALGCMIYELCALRPPFLGDSFPALKRAVTAGRYQPIPRQYKEALHRVVGSMIRVNPRERPSAEALLRSPELASKLQLDDGTTVFAQPPSSRENLPNLIETIKVPQNLRKLNTALPKPCYPDVRPNSPSAWTMAEQKHSKMNVDNVDQRRPGLNNNNNNRLSAVDEEPISIPAIRKEVARAAEGLPSSSERLEHVPSYHSERDRRLPPPGVPSVKPAAPYPSSNSNNSNYSNNRQQSEKVLVLPSQRGGGVAANNGQGNKGKQQQQQQAYAAQGGPVYAHAQKAQAYVPHRMW